MAETVGCSPRCCPARRHHKLLLMRAWKGEGEGAKAQVLSLALAEL